MPTRRQYYVVVTVTVFSALGLALVIPGVGYVITVLGTISNPIICFILPCMFYIKAFPGEWKRTDILIAYIVLIVMTLVGISGFILFWIELF
jgi:amino acid permease